MGYGLSHGALGVGVRGLDHRQSKDMSIQETRCVIHGVIHGMFHGVFHGVFHGMFHGKITILPEGYNPGRKKLGLCEIIPQSVYASFG
jgi:hypothetical protein